MDQTHSFSLFRGQNWFLLLWTKLKVLHKVFVLKKEQINCFIENEKGIIVLVRER